MFKNQSMVLNKKELINLIKEFPKNKIFIFSGVLKEVKSFSNIDKKGRIKNKGTMSFKFNHNYFKNSEVISDIIESKPFLLIPCDKEVLSNVALKKIGGK